MNTEPTMTVSAPMSSKRRTAALLSGLAFRVVNSQSEFEDLLHCRWRGYKKYGFSAPEACQDEFDKRATHYISIDTETRKVVGCLRMLIKSKGPLELESFVDISKWVESGVQPAELTRFSVPLSKRSFDIKFGLWKLAWCDALRKNISHFIIWTRKEAQRNYDMLGFQYLLGNRETFCHPRLGNHPHFLMILDIVQARDEYRDYRPQLFNFFCELTHPEISLETQANQ